MTLPHQMLVDRGELKTQQDVLKFLSEMKKRHRGGLDQEGHSIAGNAPEVPRCSFDLNLTRILS